MARSAPPRLIAITDLGVLSEPELVARLRRLAELAEAGGVALLLRDHTASATQRLHFGQALRDVARSSGQELWVADRLDLALLLEADGIHLGEASVPAPAARRLVGDTIRVSRAWHMPDLVAAAEGELDEVDALLLSPVLAPRKGRLALGLPALGALGEQLRARGKACQLYALGGILPENAGACRVAGAFGVAAIGAALAADPGPLLDALELRR